MRPSKARALAVVAALLGVSGIGAQAWAQGGGFYVSIGSTWKYFRGLEEASTPDPSAWRQIGFVDSSWSSGAAPFGYGEQSLGTDLGLLAPPMSKNYTTLFLRKGFEVADPDHVAGLVIRADYDDGVIAWVNGAEVLRVNVAGQPGDAVAYNALAAFPHESGRFEQFLLRDPGRYLVAGTNVLAVQVFNVAVSNVDLKFDLELFWLPDRTPPIAAAQVPASDATIHSLTRIEVTFSEKVTGVNASDLLINGQPAASAKGSGRGPYTFNFRQPPFGRVEVTWVPDHGITDRADPPNGFARGSWTYTLDAALPSSDLVINEFLASNVDRSQPQPDSDGNPLRDEDRDAEDWIEIYNRGSRAVNLLGWALTDERDDPGKWTFPDISIGPRKYLVVFASGKDRKPSSGGNLHTNFKLSVAGEYLALHSAEAPPRAAMELAPEFPEQRADHSYGLDASGALVYFNHPTPGAANKGPLVPLTGFVEDPQATVPRGFHEEPFSVELTTATGGAAIFYTLDGSEPTEFGRPYTGPLEIAGTSGKAVVTLRAKAIKVPGPEDKNGYLPSKVTTYTYIFPDHVRTQPSYPPGFPSTWGSGQVRTNADYAMDPRVAQDDRLKQGLKDIPTLSIVMNLADLFDPGKGIYSNPSLEGVAWERPVSAELLFPGSSGGFQIDCGLRIQGFSSTLNWKSLKLSLRLLFKDDHGSAKLRFPLFAGSRVKEFDTLILDAGLNLTWHTPFPEQNLRAQYVRDQFVSDLQIASGSPGPHGLFVNLYLNGLYWGLYNIHERPDASFAAEYLGGDKSEYDVLRHAGSQFIDGNAEAWNAMMNLVRAGVSTNAQYEAVQAYLDVSNLIDYMIINLYAGNDDWPRHNWYAARRRAPGGRFRFFSWDAEHVLKSVFINQTGVRNPGTPAEIYSRLRENDEFRLLFADRVHRHFQKGGILYVDPDNPAWDPARPDRNVPAALYMRRIEEIDPGIVAESARWGDVQRPGAPYTRDKEWADELNWLLTQHFPERSRVVLDQFRAAGLYPSLDAPVFSREGGTIQPGFTLTMTLPSGTSGTIFFTTDGSDPRVYGSGAVSASAKTYAGPLPLTDYTRVKARVQSGAAWSALSEATFTVPAPFEALAITEIMYNPSGGTDYEFIELENTGTRTLDLSDLHFTEGINFTFSPNTALGPGESFVLVSNPTAFTARYPGVTIGGIYGANLANGGEKVTLADAAGKPVLSVDYDDDGFWPVGPDGFGYSLVLLDPTMDPDDPENWRSSANPHGSPGAADPSPRHGGVVVSEVLASAGAPLEDAIELFNPTEQDIAIGGWYLSDSREDESSLRKFRIPDGTVIAAGGYQVFYEYQFNAGASPGFELGPLGWAVYLSSADANGSLTGHIAGARFDGAASGVSVGRYATSSGLDFTALEARTFGADAPATVEEFRTGAGGANSPPKVGPVVFNEIMYHPPDGGEEFIELFNLTDSPILLSDPDSARGWQIAGIRNLDGSGAYEFPLDAVIERKGYLLVVQIDPIAAPERFEAFLSRHEVPHGVPVIGPYGGALDNAGERLKLSRPGPAHDPASYVPVDQVRYNDRAPWPTRADGGGRSLERILSSGYGNDPVNWGASLEAGGTPGLINSQRPNQLPVASFSAEPGVGPAPLEVMFDASGSYDPDGTITSFEWHFGEVIPGSGKTVGHVFKDPGTYTVTLKVTDDRDAQVTAALSIVVKEPPKPSGGQIPGDATQDGRLDISDGITILGLFFSGFASLPCEGTLADLGNRTLLDLNGDRSVTVVDAIQALNFYMGSGPAHVLGTNCVLMPGCPDLCSPAGTK